MLCYVDPDPDPDPDSDPDSDFDFDKMYPGCKILSRWPIVYTVKPPISAFKSAAKGASFSALVLTRALLSEMSSVT